MRNTLLRKYIDSEHIYEIMGHSVRVYIEIAAKYIALITIAALTYIYILGPIGYRRIQRLSAGVGIIIYLKCLYDIFDEYLDVMLITEQGLIHFQRDGLWSHTSEILQWVSIESISDKQDTFRDSLVGKGNISIKLEDTITRFTNIENPSKTTSKILGYKEKILGRQNYLENEVRPIPTESHDKYKILVEALGEVVSEYVDKKNNDNMYY